MLHRDGRVVWVRDEAVPVMEEGRQLWWGVMLDVTERREAEESLKVSEERFRLVARATREAIWDHDLLTDEQEWTGATEALFGYPAHKSTEGAWWRERIHPEDKERVLSGLQAVLDGGGKLWMEEYRFRCADGTYATVVDRGYVVRGEEGRPVRMVGSMADVTERRRAEEALRESEDRFRVTFESAAVGMAHLALDGRWLRINDKLLETVGYEREELLSLTFQDITHPEDLDKDLRHVRRMRSGEIKTYSTQKRYIRKDGRRVWIGLSVLTVLGSSEESGYFATIAQDITLRKLEELVHKPLSPQELEVLRLAAQGQRNPEIARTLRYSLSMIKLHVHSILVKLDAKDRAEAARRAVEIGLIPPPC